MTPSLEETQSFLEKLAVRWDLGAHHRSSLLGHAEATEEREGRIIALTSMVMALNSLFPDQETENIWVHKPQPVLDGKVPVECAVGTLHDVIWAAEWIEEMDRKSRGE